MRKIFFELNNKEHLTKAGCFLLRLKKLAETVKRPEASKRYLLLIFTMLFTVSDIWAPFFTHS